jgi:hypothetical protein
MKIDYEVYSNDAHAGTSGGEAWLDDDWELKEYGIQIGDISISAITPKQMVTLACAMVNHLAVNGHRFELVKDSHQDQHMELKYLGQ